MSKIKICGVEITPLSHGPSMDSKCRCIRNLYHLYYYMNPEGVSHSKWKSELFRKVAQFYGLTKRNKNLRIYSHWKRANPLTEGWRQKIIAWRDELGLRQKPVTDSPSPVAEEEKRPVCVQGTLFPVSPTHAPIT